MAGAGSRFAKAGFADPKPLIKIFGKPMIEIVVDNLRPTIKHRFIFICQKKHLEKYNLEDKLSKIAPNSQIVVIDGLTEGAACTVLAAEKFINNEIPLMIANSDQYIDYSIDTYLEKQFKDSCDGLVMTMKANDPKWSFIGFNKNNEVERIVEKEVISDEATVGIYNFSKGSDFVYGAKKMIQEDLRVNGEFYVAPVYNILLKENVYKIEIVNIGSEQNGMYGLGIPDDLNFFLKTDIAKKINL